MPAIPREADLRRMLLRGAKRCYRFSEARRGAERLRKVIDPSDGCVDCLLLNYPLPDMGAIELLAALRDGADLPPCPVVVIAAANIDEGPALLRACSQDDIGKRGTSAEGLTRAVAHSIERFGLLRARSAARRDPDEHPSARHERHASHGAAGA